MVQAATDFGGVQLLALIGAVALVIHVARVDLRAARRADRLDSDQT